MRQTPEAINPYDGLQEKSADANQAESCCLNQDVRGKVPTATGDTRRCSPSSRRDAARSHALIDDGTPVMQQWRRPLLPCANAMILVAFCVLLAAFQTIVAFRIYRIFSEISGPSVAGFLACIPPTTWILLACTVGIWFERRWGRSGLRTYATIVLLVDLTLGWWTASLVDRPIFFRPVIVDGFVCLCAWRLRYRDEFAELSWRQRIANTFRGTLGSVRLLWHLIRRLLGLSYLPFRTDPVALGYGGTWTFDRELATLGVPRAKDEGWRVVSQIAVTTRQLVVFDPMFFHDGGCGNECFALSDIPNGLYDLELQIVRFRDPVGYVVLRAQLFWRDDDVTTGGCAEEIGVDSATLCIGDPDRITEAWRKREDAEDDECEFLPARALWKAGLPGDSNPSVVTAFQSAFGDGGYPIYVLGDERGGLGIMIDMAGEDRTNTIVLARRRGWRQPRPAGT